MPSALPSDLRESSLTSLLLCLHEAAGLDNARHALPLSNPLLKMAENDLLRSTLQVALCKTTAAETLSRTCGVVKKSRRVFVLQELVRSVLAFFRHQRSSVLLLEKKQTAVMV